MMMMNVSQRIKEVILCKNTRSTAFSVGRTYRTKFWGVGVPEAVTTVNDIYECLRATETW